MQQVETERQTNKQVPIQTVFILYSVRIKGLSLMSDLYSVIYSASFGTSAK